MWGMRMIPGGLHVWALNRRRIAALVPPPRPSVPPLRLSSSLRRHLQPHPWSARGRSPFFLGPASTSLFHPSAPLQLKSLIRPAPGCPLTLPLPRSRYGHLRGRKSRFALSSPFPIEPAPIARRGTQGPSLHEGMPGQRNTLIADYAARNSCHWSCLLLLKNSPETGRILFTLQNPSSTGNRASLTLRLGRSALPELCVQEASRYLQLGP